ncbi:hypothetical protein D3C86_2054530 [compost metagenome]
MLFMIKAEPSFTIGTINKNVVCTALRSVPVMTGSFREITNMADIKGIQKKIIFRFTLK